MFIVEIPGKWKGKTKNPTGPTIGRQVPSTFWCNIISGSSRRVFLAIWACHLPPVSGRDQTPQSSII